MLTMSTLAVSPASLSEFVPIARNLYCLNHGTMSGSVGTEMAILE